jgi:hypothetical protein
VLVVRGSHNM